MKIIINRIQCRKCCDIIVSRHVHDFQKCKCGVIAVDGGSEYFRRVGELDQFIDRSVFHIEPQDRDLQIKGAFIVYSPGGRTNPQTAFLDRRDAAEMASKMKNEYKSFFMVAELL